MSAMTRPGSWLSGDPVTPNGAVMFISSKAPIIRCTPATSWIPSISANSDCTGVRPSASIRASSMHEA